MRFKPLQSPKLVDPGYYPAMWRLIKDKIGMPENAIELGTRWGFWTHGLIENVGIGCRVYCVDLWPPHRNFAFYARGWLQTLGDYAFTKAIPLRGSTTEWSMALDVVADLIYVDARHHYQNCLDDIRNWWPLLRAGGLMLIHDMNFKGVSNATNDFFRDRHEEVVIEKFGPARKTLTGWVVKSQDVS